MIVQVHSLLVIIITRIRKQCSFDHIESNRAGYLMPSNQTVPRQELLLFCAKNVFPVHLGGKLLKMDGPPTPTDELSSKGGTYSIMITFRPQFAVPGENKTEAIIHQMHSHNFLNITPLYLANCKLYRSILDILNYGLFENVYGNWVIFACPTYLHNYDEELKIVP